MTGPVSGEMTEVLVARVRGRSCVLPIADVIETMRPLPIEPIVGAPAAVLGLAVIRGAPTAVVDPGELFDDTPRATGRFVTVRLGSRTVALAFDAVIGVRKIPRESFQALPQLLGDASTGAISAIAVVDAELLLVLRAARFVPLELLRELDALQGGP